MFWLLLSKWLQQKICRNAAVYLLVWAQCPNPMLTPKSAWVGPSGICRTKRRQRGFYLQHHKLFRSVFAAACAAKKADGIPYHISKSRLRGVIRTSSPENLWMLHPWSYFKLDWPSPWAADSSWFSSEQETGLDNLQRSPCDSVIRLSVTSWEKLGKQQVLHRGRARLY